MKPLNVLQIIFPVLLLDACIRTTILKNGREKAAINPMVYKNRIHFDKSILNQIDTTVIYEEYNTTYYIGDNPVNVLARDNYQNPDTYYMVYRFYGNGCFNLFHLNRENSVLTKELFDPGYTGWRGVLYSENGQIKGDLITQISAGGIIGKLTETFEFNGDTLIVTSKTPTWKYIFLKRNISTDLLKFTAGW